MWKAAFGGRSERGGGSTFDDAASTSSRRRRHRRSSPDDTKSAVSSASRRTGGDRKHVSRNDTGVSYGSAPIPPRLTESAVNAFNANDDDDDDDIWEDEADLKSERRSKRSESRERRHRRKSSGRSERSRSRERESSSKHKKSSSGRSERSRSRERERERDGWTRKSNGGRSERSRSRERDDKDRKRKDEKSSRVEQPNGKSRILAIMDEADDISVMPSSIASYDRVPLATNPSTVRFDEPTMSGALDSHVNSQFPGQNPSTYTKSDFDPNPHGAAADYYNDRGQSVKHQPGERAFTPNPLGGVSGKSSVAAPSGSTKPSKSSSSSKPSKLSSSSSAPASKPSKKSSSRGISPPASTMTTPTTVYGGAAAASAANMNHHMQARASTQYDQSELSQTTDFVHDRVHDIRPLPSTYSGPSAPTRHNSEPLPPTVGAASSYYDTTIPTNPTGSSGMYPPSQANKGKYAAAAGVAAAGAAAYGMSQHNQHNQHEQQSQFTQHEQRTQYDQHTQHDQRTQYSEVNSQYGPPPSYGPHSQYGSQAPERHGSHYGSASGGLPTGMHYRHEHKGPISRLKDGFLNLLSSPEDVAKMEEYTEYIGVCKNCFDPRSSPWAGPRKHHYHPRKKDSFETLRRRSLERLQRRRSDESLRRTNSKVHKENRYFSSDRKTSSNSNATYLAGGLAVAGAAAAGASMFSDRKNFDDTYSVKSGHRATSAVRRRGSNSSIESRRRTSRGRVASDRHEEFVTVQTKDGRVENRKVHRSRSGSTGRKSNWIGPAAAIGAAGAATVASRHRRRSSPDQGSLHPNERRHQSRSSSRSHSPGLGEIFGFTAPPPRRSGRRSPFGSYQDSRKEQQRRKEKGGFFNFSNGSASSSESGMAFGDINGSNLSRKSSGRSTTSRRKVSKQSSDEKLNKTLLGIGATAAALTVASKMSKAPKPGPRPSLGARRDVRVSQYGPSGHKTGPPGSSDEGEWVDELPSDASSTETGLAFGDGNERRRLSSRPSMDSVSSHSSSNDGLSAWGWRWGNKKQKKQRPTTPPDYQQHPSASTLPIAGAGLAAAGGAATDAYGRRVPSDVGLIDNTAAPQAPMQYIDPQPLSEVGSRYSSMPGAFEDPPLQQPQPIAPFQPAFTQGSPEDPMRPTAGPTGKPAMRRSVSSPTQTKSSFMGDAAFIGGAAVATAGIIASQNRKSSPGVRFGFNGEQQEKYDRELREEREREDRERRRADRTRALKEEAERFARDEDEKRVLAEQKRRQQEDEEREHQRQLENRQREEAYRREQEDKEHQRQLENHQREEAYRREQAQLAEESRRRIEQEREAEERERQAANDRQIREELERKQREREEKSRKSKGKKKDRAQDEESQHSSWKGPVAAGMAGALAGAVLDGALHKEGRERTQKNERSRETYSTHDDEKYRESYSTRKEDRAREPYSTQTFEPTYEHSGAPITDDDLIDPDFFKRRHSAAELEQYDQLSREKLDELTHEREDYYNLPSQSQKDFFMPKELLDKQSEGKERVADPFGDNEVDVYSATGGEARHVYGNDYGKYGQAPRVHQNVPKLIVIAPTPPDSTAGSTLGDKSAVSSPLTEIRNVDSPAADDVVVVVEEMTPDGRGNADFYQRPFAQSVSDFTTIGSPGIGGAPPVRGWVEGEANEEEARHIPGGFNDSVYEGRPQPIAESAVWEPPKKDKKKRDKAGKRDSEPATPQEEDVPTATRSVSFDEPQETFETPSSKKDKKKKGKAAKQTSTFDEEPAINEPEPAPEPVIVAEPLPIEDDFPAPPSKKDKKKKGKKSATFDEPEPEPAVNEVSQPDAVPVSASPRVDDSAWDPPLSKKEQKKRDKAAKSGLPMEDSQPSTPVNERDFEYVAAEPESASQVIEPGTTDAWEPPLSKKDKKKREKDAKLGKSLDGFEQASPLEQPAEPLSETRAVEEEPAWEPPLSKKDKKKREKESKQGSPYDTPEPSTPVEEPAESMSASRELDAEPSWDALLSKKDKKKREKESKSAFTFDEPSTPPNETTQRDEDPLVQQVADAFEAPLSKKDKKKREKEAQRQSLGLDDFAPEPSVSESRDAIVEQTREMEAEPLFPSQENAAEPGWEPPVSKKDKKKRDKEGKRQSVSFEDPELSSSAPEFAEAEQSRGPDAEAAWEPPLSKKEQKKREKEAGSMGFGDVAAAVMTTAGVAAIANAVTKPEEDDHAFDSGKKSKKSKKSKGQSFDDGSNDMPGAWDESSSDAAKDPHAAASSTDKDFPRDGERSPTQEPTADDLYGSADAKKSKKKKKRESSRFSEPAIGSPLRSEIAFDDYVGESSRDNGTRSDRARSIGARSVDAATYADVEATGYGRGGRGPSYYDDDYPSGGRRSSPRESPRGSPHGSRRAMSPDDTAQSAVSAPTLERRRSSKSKSKRSSGVYEGEVDFDDTRSIRSSATAPASSSKKEKKGGLFGMFSRSKSIDGDKREQSFLGDRVEDLPPLPLDSQASTISASAQEEQDRGTPAPAEAVEQAVIADAISQDDTKTIQSGEASEQALSPDSLTFAPRPAISTRPLSSTSVPLRFKPFPSSPSLPKERSQSFGSAADSRPESPSSVSASGSHKKPRPRSSEFREVMPLYLVSRNSKLEDVEEQLPDLPDSKPSSRSSSVQGSEDWHSAAEDMSPQPDVDYSPKIRRELTIDLDQANKYRTEEEIMDTADQTTPKASDFPQTALYTPRSQTKQVPQFYTWEDLAKDEEMHEAAARQAEGGVDANVPGHDATEGLGIDQDGKRTSSPARKSSKKDKRKGKGLVSAAAALVGGAAAGILLAPDSKKDETDEPTPETVESDTQPPSSKQIDDIAHDPAVTSSDSIYHAPIAGGSGVNTDIWGDPMGDAAQAPEQAGAAEDVWGDEEFADRPSLPREMAAGAEAADTELDPMALPAEGAPPARTGGPMTDVQESFDDWFGSTDPTPKEPILLKGKKGKKAKKGKATPAKPAEPAPAEAAASQPAAEPIETEQATREMPVVDQDVKVEDPNTPAIEAPKQSAVSEQSMPSEDSKADTAIPNESQSEDTALETTQASDEASRELPTESPAAVHADATDDFLAPASSKKGKKAKKGKKGQSASEEVVEDSSAGPTQASSEATEAPAAQQSPAEEANPQVPALSTNDPANTDPSPPLDDEWASMSTSKKEKKAKKGKKQKSDDWMEPEAQPEQVQEPSASEPVAVPVGTAAEPSLAVGEEPQVKAGNETTMEPSADSKPTEETTALAETVNEKSEPTLTNADKPALSTEPASTSEKEQSSGGWLSWRPWGAKKAVDEGPEADTVVMQARELPEAAQDFKTEVLDSEKQSDEFVTPEEKAHGTDQLMQDKDMSTNLLEDNNSPPQADPASDLLPKPELASRELDAAPAIKQDEPASEPTTQPDLPVVEQQDVPATFAATDDQKPHTPAEQSEVVEDLWAAPSSKKKKGKKGKKSGQTTPLVTAEEPVAEHIASTPAEGLQASDDKAPQPSDAQSPPNEAREVPETTEPQSREGDAFWAPEPSKKKKGKKNKNSDPVTEELPVVAPVDDVASATAFESEQAQTATEERAVPDTVLTPEAEKPEEGDSFSTPQSTKKKSKKGKKNAAASAWDELVEENAPVEITSAEPYLLPQHESAEVSFVKEADTHTAAEPDIVAPDTTPAIEPTTLDAQTAIEPDTVASDTTPSNEPTTQEALEPAADDVWDALPSKKKGKKGKKAAKEPTVEPTADDPPPPQEETTSTEDADKPQDVQPSEPTPEQVQVATEQPLADPIVEQEPTLEQVETPAEHLPADPIVEQETPAAEPDEFWEPQPKGKKGKKGKKARSDPVEEPQPVELSTTLDDQAISPAPDNTEATQVATESNEAVQDTPEETGAADFWEPPAKGKKAKKSKKNKGGVDAFETPSEANEEPTPGSQSAAESLDAQVADVPDAAEAAQEMPAPVDVVAAPEQVIESEPAAAEDDWSALTASKKSKKGKKGKKAALEPEPSDLSAEQTTPDLIAESAEPPSEPPQDTQEPVVEPPKDAEAEPEPIIVEQSASQDDKTQTEPSTAQDLNRDVPSDVAPQGPTQDDKLPEQSKIESDPVATTDAQEAQVPDDTVEAEPTPTSKKSKKDKKKNRKSQAVETDEPIPSPAEDQAVLEEEAQLELPIEPPQDVPQPDVPAPDENAANPAEEVDEWGSIATTKKSKKDKKKNKKGKGADSEDLTATPQSEDPVAESSTVPQDEQTPAVEGASVDPLSVQPDEQGIAADSTTVPVVDPSSVQTNDQAVAIDSTLIPASETEGAAADYYAGHPENPEPAIEDPAIKDQADEGLTSTARDAQPSAEAEPVEEFDTFSSKKSKKDKKKSKKSAASAWDTPEGEAAPPENETPAAIASTDNEPAVIEETSTAATDADPAPIEETQPAETEPVEELGVFSAKKSKKDKKKGKKAASDSWDIPGEESAPAETEKSVEAAPENATEADPAPIEELQPTVPDPDEEVGTSSSKKSKKDKKKGKKSAAESWDAPQEGIIPAETETPAPAAIDAEPAPVEEMQPTEAEPTEEFSASSSKKSKKDKKKAKKTAGDSCDVADPQIAAADQPSSTVIPAGFDDVEPSPSQDATIQDAPTQDVQNEDAPNPSVEPSVEAHSLEAADIIPQDNDANAEEEFAESTKKSKKDKKKAKKSKNVGWDEPSEDVTAPAGATIEGAPVLDEPFAPETSLPDATSTTLEQPVNATPDATTDTQPIAGEPDIASDEIAPVPLESATTTEDTATREMTQIDAPQADAEPENDESGSFSSKKSKKDKKKAKKSQSEFSSLEEPEMSTPALEASPDANEPITIAAEELKASSVDDAPEASVSQEPVPENEPTPAPMEPQEDADFFGLTSSKKSKKDKKKAKKSSAAATPDVDESISTERALEEHLDLSQQNDAQDNDATPQQEAVEPSTDPAELQEPVAAPTGPVAENDGEAFGSFTSKKSKKDKKKAKKAQDSDAQVEDSTPTTPVAIEEEPVSVPEPSNDTNALEGTVNTSSDPVVVEPAISETVEGQPDVAAEDLWAAPTKKSKKDKKKGKKAQEMEPEAVPAVDEAKPAESELEVLPESIESAREMSGENLEVQNDTAVPEAVEQPQETEADDPWAAPVKKSKKDKKKGKKAQSDEAEADVAPSDGDANPAQQEPEVVLDPTPIAAEITPDTDQVALDDTTTPATEPSPEEADAWGSISTKKSKKDKKKSKKAQFDETDPEVTPADDNAKPEEQAPEALDSMPATADTVPDNNQVAIDDSTAIPAAEQSPEDTDAWGSPSTKKSKKDKKKSKKAQIDEPEPEPDVMPIEDSAKPAEQEPENPEPTPATTEFVPDSDQIAIEDATMVPSVEQSPEDADAWGSLSTKKSKKDKKKSKKAKTGDEDLIGEDPATPVDEETKVEAPGEADTSAVADVQEAPEDPWAETSAKQTKKEKRKSKKNGQPEDTIIGDTEPTVSEPLERALEPTPPEQPNTEELPVSSEAPISSDLPDATPDVISDATRDMDTIKSDEQNSAINPNEPVASELPGQDIDFAATLAAGLADSGFDPNLVVDDPVFHRRASPTIGVAEADPEEVFKTSGKKKKGKGKKSGGEELVPDEAGPSTTAVPAPDDFDAALSQGLQDSGFDPSLLSGVVSNSQEPVSTTLQDEDEFSFTKSNKKKKKGKKGKEVAEAGDAPSPVVDSLEASTAFPEEETANVDLSASQSQMQVDDVKQDAVTDASNDPPLSATQEPVEAADDDWGVPTKSKKKSKKDKKQQDRFLDVEESATPVADMAATDATSVPNAQEAPPPTPDAEPEVPAPSTEVTGEDEWGAPSKKKKGKKGKKQQGVDLQDDDNTPAAVEPSTAPATEDKPEESVTEELPPAASEQPDPVVEDEWAAPSFMKKKGRKNKKNLDSDFPAEEAKPPLDATVPAEASEGLNEPLLDAPVAVAQDNAEPDVVETPSADLQPATILATEETPAVSEAIEEDRAAPSKKKDKKNKTKKGVAWDEPEAAREETPTPFVEEAPADIEQIPHETDTTTRDMNSADSLLPTESAEPTPVTTEATQGADDEWGAPSKKKKGKKSIDAWAKSDTPALDTVPSTPAAVDVVEDSAVQPEGQDVPAANIEDAVGGAAKSAVEPAFPNESVAETAEDEWGPPSKKKGKKNRKKGALDFEPETQPEEPVVEPTQLAEEPSREVESANDREIPEDFAATSPAPADASQQDSWDLPVKKKGKKSKKNQGLTEDQSEAPAPETPAFEAVPETQAPRTVTTPESAHHKFDEPILPTERSLGAAFEPVLPSTPDATTIQPESHSETAPGGDEWGLSSKKKGKNNKKKGSASDADLDPFTSAPIESPAPTSATDTAEASAAEGSEPVMPDAFQAGREMDVDEMDKAYKAYKKNKRKQKKLQNTQGDDKQQPNSEQDSGQQSGTDRGLDVSQETQPIRQPSPLANAEPSWSFATIDNGKGETGRRLSRPTSNGSLTSRRSMEPLHLDTGSRPASQGGEQQQQQQPQQPPPEPLENSHGRTESRDTPLEPTSRNRASYLFQSPAPFPEPTSDNASGSLRTPEQRGDATDYFHSGPTNETFSPSAGPMSPKIALDPIPEEFAAHKRSLGDATNITPMEPAGKMQRRTETPKAIREQELSLSKSRDSAASSAARSVSNPVSGFDEERSSKRVVSDIRSPSAMSNRSNYSINQHVTPEDRRTLSRASNRSVTPTLRRTHLSGDLRAASRTSNRRGDAGAGSAVGVGARTSPKTIPFEPPPTPPLNDEDDVVAPGATRAAGMAETFQGYGGVQQAQVSPTRPPSMRKRQSMHVMDLESKLEQLTSENRALQEAQQSRGLDDASFGASGQSLQQTLEARELELREKNNEIQQIQAMLEPMQQEINRLVQINGGLTEANRNLVDDTNGRYATLQNEHAHANQQWQKTTRELENMRQEHSRLSNGMRDAVAAQLSTALAEKDHEIRKLKQELGEASERIRALQVQIQSSKTSDFLSIRDEDYFDGACQKLCQHVQQWVLRFSKMSDNRICRLSSDLKDEKIEARLDNALLDGMDVDKLLGDRVRRRDVFMSVVMTMVWEYVFTRYLFGMDREQRQKLKALEKTLSEVGPPRAVAQWRATTLTLLSKRPAFSKQCSLDTEAVAHEIFGVLSALLTPPSGSEQQLLTSLTKVITVAVNLSVEMRTQRAEYIMLPPLQPEYDTKGDLVRKVHFNASLMNERSGLFTSNEALEAERAIVKIVLFPLVVKKGDEFGEGEEEIVVCPAQVLVHNDNGKSRKVVRVLSGAMEIDDPRRSSKQSLLSRAGSMQF